MEVYQNGDLIEYFPSTSSSSNASTRWHIRAYPTADGYQMATTDDDYATYSDTVSTVQDWSLDNNVETNSFVASNTGTYNVKSAGKRSASGKFTGIGAFPPLNPGNRFLFRGFLGPESRSYKMAHESLAGKFRYDCKGYPTVPIENAAVCLKKRQRVTRGHCGSFTALTLSVIRRGK